MAIRTTVIRGYGNSTFNGTIPLVVTRGYAIGEEALPFATPASPARSFDAVTAAPSRNFGAIAASPSRSFGVDPVTE